MVFFELFGVRLVIGYKCRQIGDLCLDAHLNYFILELMVPGCIL